MNNTICTEQLLSGMCSTGAHQHQSQQVQLSPVDDDNQGNVPGSTAAADGDDYDRDSERHCPVIKLDDQRELASGTHASLIADKHADANGVDRTIALLTQPESNRKGCRYNNNQHLSALQG